MLKKSAQAQQSQGRVHPLIPTYQEALDGSSVYSSHLPVIATVPIDDVNVDNNLKVLSYNMMGYQVIPLTRKIITLEEPDARYVQIADGLAKCAEQQGLDVILLQTVLEERFMIEKLQEILGEQWAFKGGNGKVTCYKKERLELKASEGALQNSRNSLYLPSEFQCKQTGNIIEAYNVGHRRAPASVDFPRHQIMGSEDKYMELLLRKDLNTISILLGDFDCRIAPLDNKPRNLTTSVIQDEETKGRQIPDHTEGGFYSPANSGEIHQLECQVVDISDGKICRDDRTIGKITAKATDENERAIWHTHRPILCLDDSYQTTSPVFTNGTIFDYGAMLKIQLKDTEILIRRTATINNEKGIVFSASVVLRYSMLRILAAAFNDSPALHDLIFVPDEKIEDFEKAIDIIYQYNLHLFDNLDPTIIEKLFEISLLDQSELSQRASDAIKAASTDYRNNKKSDCRVRGDGETFFNSLTSSFEFFGSIHRENRAAILKKRMDRVESTNQTDLEKLLSLLGDDAEGDKNLDSFKYFLASYFLGVEVSTDEEAAMLVDFVRDEVQEIISNGLAQDLQESESGSDSIPLTLG